nr:GNAT family N-acetyltransferase [Actinomadura sp. BRA 177]
MPLYVLCFNSAPPHAIYSIRFVGSVRCVHETAQADHLCGAPTLDAAEMVRLRVLPTLQRRGYGAALVRALEQRAAEYGYRILRADTTELQAPALALYRKLGWTETRREPIGGIVNIYLQKPLR